eukprot:4910834-Heterocapsa_arctica.AAC.1
MRPGAAVSEAPIANAIAHDIKKKPAAAGINKKPAGSGGVQRKPVAIVAHPKGSEEVLLFDDY